MTLTDKIFLPAAKEYGLTGYARAEENSALTTYQWYQTHNTNTDRIKYKNGNLTSDGAYWTRSPFSGDTSIVVIVSRGGRENDSYTSDSVRVAPVFAW